MGGYAGAVAGEPELFLSRGLYADLAGLQAGGAGDVRAHFVYIGREPGPLRYDRGVDVGDGISLRAQDARNLGQELEAARPGVALVRVRETLPYVAERRGAEQGVHYGVYQHIRVRMAEKAPLVGDINPAEYQLPALCKAVHVVTMANPEHQASPLFSKIASAA